MKFNMIIVVILIYFGKDVYGVPINWGTCENPSFSNSLIIRGNSFGIMSKSGSILDGVTQQPILNFKTSCLAWAPADAVFTYPNSNQVFARLDQQNLAVGDKIRLKNCNQTVITIYREQILSTIISLGFELQYDIQNPQEVMYAQTDSIHLFDTSMTVRQNNEIIATFNMPFGEKIKKMWLGEQDATISFSGNQTLSSGENRMVPAGLATYYLILASLSRDSHGNIVPPVCNTLYRWGIIIGVCIGGIAVLCLGLFIWKKLKKCK